MKIAGLTVWAKTLPLAQPYALSGGRLRLDSLDCTVVRVDTDTGQAGWGEGTPWGHTYVVAHGPGIRAGIQTLAPAILGLDPRQVGVVEHAMDRALPGHLYAKAPVDMACWDIAGQAAGLSIADLLGGAFPGAIPIASSVPTDTPEAMIARIGAERARGYRVHSVKIGADAGADIARIRAIEAARLPGERILYDVNRAWSRRQALAVMTAVADLPIAVEQPGETLDDIAAIRPLTRLAISVDERLETLGDMVRIARDGLAEIVNIKLNRVGGPSKARRIRDVALAHGIDVYVMATGGTVLADTEALHLAQTVPPEARLGVWCCQDMIATDPAPGRGPRRVDGTLTAPSAPGLGIAPDLAWLGAPVAEYRA
ncbi:MAG: enolase C-terminal domain-like protein [Pseudomonadota bacterium]